MNLGEICIRDTVCAERNTPVQQAAHLMRTHHVGDLIIVEQGPHGSIPVGIVTDRDIVVEVLAARIDPLRLSVGDIMSERRPDYGAREPGYLRNRFADENSWNPALTCCRPAGLPCGDRIRGRSAGASVHAPLSLGEDHCA